MTLPQALLQAQPKIQPQPNIGPQLSLPYTGSAITVSAYALSRTAGRGHLIHSADRPPYRVQPQRVTAVLLVQYRPNYFRNSICWLLLQFFACREHHTIMVTQVVQALHQT